MATMHDPGWRHPAASRRGGQLYIKLPLNWGKLLQAVLIAQLASCTPPQKKGLTSFLNFFSKQLTASQEAGQSCLVIALDLQLAQEDLTLLEDLGSYSPILKRYLGVLQQGLQSDPEVDWILRSGGPKPKSTDFLQLAKKDALKNT